MKLYITTMLYIILLAHTAQNIGMDGSFTTNNGIPIPPMALTEYDAADAATTIINFAAPLDPAVVDIAYRHAPASIRRLTDKLENFQDDPENFPAMLRTKRQYLLTGKSGVGKTTLAKAIAQKAGWLCADVPVAESSTKYRNSEADALTLHINTVLNRYRKCVILLDEMTIVTDSHGKEQHDGDAKAATILWKLLDKCKERPDIVVIGTTNDDSKLPAPLKSRFNNKGIITIPMPALEVRAELLNHLFTDIGLPLDEAYLNKIAKRTNGKSFRDIIDFSEQAADHAVDNGHDITQEDIDAIIATWRPWYHYNELYNTYAPSRKDIIKTLPITIPITLTIIGLGLTIWQFKKQQKATADQLKEQNRRAEEQAAEHRKEIASAKNFQFWGLVAQGVSVGVNGVSTIITHRETIWNGIKIIGNVTLGTPL